MGDITAFVDSPWVETFENLIKGIRQYRQEMSTRKSAPVREQKLKEEMKRFGL
jgi:hypothetical protein